MLKPTQRRFALVVAVVVAVSVGGIGARARQLAPVGSSAKAKGKKKNHVLSADYKTSPVSVIDETENSVEFSDDAKLVGRPSDSTAPSDEDSVLTYNQPRPSPDFSGTEHTTFKAVFYAIALLQGLL